MGIKIELFTNSRGDSPVEEFLYQLTEKARLKCVKYIEIFEDRGKTLQGQYISRLPGTASLWEIRPEYAGTEYRILMAEISESHFVLLHAFKKKRGKIEHRHIETAEERFKDFLSRETEGD